MTRWLLAAGVVAAQGFERDLQPVFRKHCFGCHAAAVKIGSLDLETHEGVMRGGNQGIIVTPGKASESRLYLTLTGAMEPFMPMGGKRLSGPELEIVKRWIDAGAHPDPGGLAWRGDLLALGWGGELRILDTTGRLVRKISAQVGTVLGVGLSADGRFAGAEGSSGVKMYSVLDGTEAKAVEMEFQRGRVALSSDGRRRAVVEDNGSVRFDER